MKNIPFLKQVTALPKERSTLEDQRERLAASEIGNPCVPRDDVHSQGSGKLYGAERSFAAR